MNYVGKQSTPKTTVQKNLNQFLIQETSMVRNLVYNHGSKQNNRKINSQLSGNK